MRTRPARFMSLVLLGALACTARAQVGTFPFGRQHSTAPAAMAGSSASPVVGQPVSYAPANNGAPAAQGYPQPTWAAPRSSFFSSIPVQLPPVSSWLSGFRHQPSAAAAPEVPVGATTGYYANARWPAHTSQWPAPSPMSAYYPTPPAERYPLYGNATPSYSYPALAGSGPPWPGTAATTKPPAPVRLPASNVAATGPPAANNVAAPYAPTSTYAPMHSASYRYPASYGPEGETTPAPNNTAPQTQPAGSPPGAAAPAYPGCDPACLPCYPQRPPVYTTIGVDVIGMRRSRGNSTPLVIDAATCCIGVGDLDFNHELGLRASIVRDRCCGWGWELAYMGVPEWTGTAEASGNVSLEGPGFQLQVYPGNYVVNYASALHSVELNWRWTDYCRWSWFAGFRYIRFNDYVTISETYTPFIDALDLDVGNDLYGFQMGVDYILYNRCGPLRIELGGRIGMYGNDSRQLTSSSFIGPPLNCRDQVFAYSAEAEIRVVYQITDCLEIRAGYQFLGIGGMALAGDQVNASDYSTGYSSIHYNHLLLDGGHLGLRYCW